MKQHDKSVLLLIAGFALLVALFLAIQIRAEDVVLGTLGVDTLTFTSGGGDNVIVGFGGGGGGETNIPQFANSITWYRFNEFTNAAGKHVDSSAVGTNTAVPAAGAAMPTWTSPSQGCYFDGGDYSAQNVGFILNGLSEVTWSIWISNAVFSADDGIFFERSANVHGLALDPAIPAAVYFYADHTRSYYEATNTVAFTNAGWTHLCFCWSNNSAAEIYINSVLVPNSLKNVTATNLVISGQGDVLKLGIDDFSAARSFIGNIDDPLIYNKKLTASEVTNLYNFGH